MEVTSDPKPWRPKPKPGVSPEPHEPLNPTIDLQIPGLGFRVRVYLGFRV